MAQVKFTHDWMHTSLLGNVSLEAGLQQFVFIGVWDLDEAHEVDTE